MVASHTWMKTVFEGTLKMRQTVFYGLSPMHGDGSTKKWRTWEIFQIFSTLWFLRGEKNIYIFNKFNQTDLWYGLETEELLNYLVSHTDKCSLSVTSTAVWFIWYPRGMVWYPHTEQMCLKHECMLDPTAKLVFATEVFPKHSWEIFCL